MKQYLTSTEPERRIQKDRVLYNRVLDVIHEAEEILYRITSRGEDYAPIKCKDLGENNNLILLLGSLMHSEFLDPNIQKQFTQVSYEQGLFLLLIHLLKAHFFKGDEETSEIVTRISEAYLLYNPCIATVEDKSRSRVINILGGDTNNLVIKTKNILSSMEDFEFGSSDKVTIYIDEVHEYLVFLKSKGILDERQFHYLSIQSDTPINLLFDLFSGLILKGTFDTEPEIFFRMYRVLHSYYDDRSEHFIKILEEKILPFLSLRYYQDSYKITPLPHNSSSS